MSLNHKSKLKRIAVFTSGGDAPGMNAAIRAVVRAGIHYNLEVMGIRYGYDGLIDGDIIPLPSSAVSGIIQRGGTILKTARSARFLKAAGREQAYKNLVKHGIEGIVAIGGDGTFRGARVFSDKYKIPFVGIPGTIDNDLYGTDFCIGYDTAINTVVEAVDKIRDTAASHDRLFFIEVMGRDAGLIALRSGIAVGAEAILIPETKTDIENIVRILERNSKLGKRSNIVIVAEGDEAGGALAIAKQVKERFDHYDTRVSILGHIQRGGNPTCADRVLGSRLGLAAVEALLKGKKNVMVGVKHKEVVFVPFAKTTKHIKTINHDLLRMADILSL